MLSMSKSLCPHDAACYWLCGTAIYTNYRLDTLKRHKITAIHKAPEEKYKCIREGKSCF